MNNPDRAALVHHIPFAATLGIEADEVTPERVTATMGWAEDQCTTGGIMHGGALMAFADMRGGAVTATCIPLHVGRTTIVVQTNVTADRGKLVAQVTQTQAVLKE